MSKQLHQQLQQQEQLNTDSTSDYEEQQELDQQAEQDEYDPLSNLLRLQLRKPSHWNWELSTSRSCSNIALPRILLYDHTGALLVNADGHSEQTYRPSSAQDCRRKRASSSLSRSLQQARLAGRLNGLSIGEATPSETHSTLRSPTRQQLTGSCIEFSTHELPDWQPLEVGSSRRSSSLRGVRLAVEEERQAQPQRTQESAYPTPPSTSTLTTTANSSSSGPREKRRYRRSHSSGQHSILERFSMTRGRHSSPEYVQEQELEHRPRYYLCSSKAGTLVIQEDSFSRVRQRRRRQRHSSAENVLSPQGKSPADSDVQVTAHKRQQSQLRCRQAPPVSSDEDADADAHKPLARHSRGRRGKRACGKDSPAPELITVDPGNCIYRAEPCATQR
ncbi:PREDICTED: uncharacterized protein LOC108619962 [Drosophila arizonae]|uniref:Uncharacterized protein LOC108619962 n=1 Tax=Drosophila arizonae TaxID=7263 RepID=A0ABM1PYK7_DROAR|nr:PREDICTED: uncharacterized protein LOC108619962 [Drosophila arizonae]